MKMERTGIILDGIKSPVFRFERRIQIVKDMITEFKKPENQSDRSIMGETTGKPMPLMAQKHMCRKMRELAEMADILTPKSYRGLHFNRTPF